MITSSLISDGMVLQREAKVRIWGRCESGQDVVVKFLDQEYTAKADQEGHWSVTMEDLQPGGPYEMTVTAGSESRVIRDVLVGDVWVLGGQSNMELPVRRTLDLLADEVKDVNLPFIRHFAVPQIYNFHGPQSEVTGGKWTKAAGDEVLDFSGTGFYFARAMYKRYGVPVGLIRTAVGGTPVEAWMSEETLRTYPGYGETIDQLKDDDYVASVKQREEASSRAWYHNLRESDEGLRGKWFEPDVDTSDWKAFEVPNSWKGTELEPIRGAVWFRRTFEVPESMAGQEVKLYVGTIVDADDTYVNGVHVGSTAYRYPPRRYVIPSGILKSGTNTITVRVVSTGSTGEFIEDMPYKIRAANGEEISLEGVWKYRLGTSVSAPEPVTFFQYKPAGLYNGVIAPLRNYVIRGALWYQGESNTGSPKGYNELFTDMVRDWRNNWGIGDFPFIYAQLPNFGPPESYQENSHWALLRHEQRKGLATVENAAMAVIIDVGEHNDLHPQDKKSVGERMAKCAMKLAFGEELVYSGPMYRSMEREGHAIRIHFDHTGSGLVAGGDGTLKGFVICGPDGKYLPAQAVISGDSVIVSNEQIQEPVHVRYAWADNPFDANLYNREGLPASPFTTETDL